MLLDCASLATISCICHVGALSVINIATGSSATSPQCGVYTPGASNSRLSNAERVRYAILLIYSPDICMWFVYLGRNYESELCVTVLLVFTEETCV